MEINNTSRSVRPPSHQIIFFNNPDTSSYKKNQSSDFQDEQELPQQNIDDDFIDEHDCSMFQGSQITVEKSNLASQQQLSGYKLNEGQSMRHPFSSSELFNAFNNDNHRGNKTIGCINSNFQPQEFTPNTGVKENHSRVISQSYIGNISQIKGGNDHKTDFNQNSLIHQRKQQSKNFFVPQNNSNIDEEMYDNNYDQEYHMTEQDFDGHDEQNQDEDQMSQDQDFDDNNTENKYSMQYYGNNQQRNNYNADNSQEEGNIPESSVSASPDDKAPQNGQIKSYQGQNMQLNRIEENDEELRDSNPIRSSDQTEKSADLPFNNNNGMIIERNDRFIIFKMVPQVNNVNAKPGETKKPALGEKQLEYNKIYRETVEEMGSDSDEENYEQDTQKYSGLDLDRPNTNLKQSSSFSPPSNNIDESLFEETHVVQHEIRTMKNQLINSQQNQKQFNKPPIGKQNSLIESSDLKNLKRNAQQIKGQRNQMDNSNEEQKQLSYDMDPNDQYKKSLTLNSQSSSDKFSRLQKLEKKNLFEENPDVVDFTMTKNNLNYLIKQSSNDNDNRAATQQMVEPIRVNERRQSDSMVILRNSLLNQQQNQQQIQDNRNQMNLSTNNTNIQTVQSTKQKPSQLNDKDNNNLIMEYQMLKKIMKQMKNEPAKTSRKTNSQKPDVSQINQSQKQQMVPQPSKKQLNARQEGVPQLQSQHLMSSYLSDEGKKLNILNHQSKYGPQTAQQSTKAKDGKNKNFFKEISKENKTAVKREVSQSKFYNQRQSPQRENKKTSNKRHKKQQHYDSEEDNDENHSQEYYKDKAGKQKVTSKFNKGKSTNYRRDKSFSDQKEEWNESEEHDSNYQSSNRSRSLISRQDKTYQDDSQQESSYQQSYDDEEGHHHHRDSRYHSNSEEESNHEYSESDDQEEEEEEDDSQQSSNHSDSDQYSQSDSQSSHHRRRNKKQSKSRKRKQSKKHKNDRKLKINIKMHGSQQPKRKKDNNNYDDIVHKQRQILQQQYMMQLAQFPQQQLLLQQQLALQQQLLLQQPQLQATPQANFFNPGNIQSTLNLNLQPQTPLDISSIQPVQPQQQQISQLQQFQSQHQPTSNINQIISQPEESRILRRNVSGKSLNQNPRGIIQSQRDFINSNLSPKRELPIKANSIYQQQQNQYNNANLSSIRSPRDQSQHSSNNYPGAQEIAAANTNYLNQLKNRFKTGTGGESNNRNIDDDYFNGGVGGGSRNKLNMISQNNSSPLTGHNRDRSQQYYNNYPEYDYRQENFNRFEEARQFALRPQYGDGNIGDLNKHQRTNSYMDYQQRPQQHQMMYNNQNEHQEDQYDHIRRKYRPDNASPRIQQNDDIDNYQIPTLQQKKTGDFAQGSKISQTKLKPQNDEIFQRNRDVSGSPGQDDGGNSSMDEGVKASTTRQTMQKSPKASVQDFQIIQMKKQNINDRAKILSSNKKQLETDLNNPRMSKQFSKDQDKKGPQAIFIGFDGEQTKDPFSNKPALKSRDKVKEQLLRSKSTKGTTPIQRNNNNMQNRKSPDTRQDKQLKSPTASKAPKVTITATDGKSIKTNLLASKQESPLKRAVNEIKLKENFSMIDTNNNAQEDQVLDSKHNKAIVIEIFDDKKKPATKEVSLAEMFKAKKKDALLSKQQDQDHQQHHPGQGSSSYAAEQDQDNQDKPIKKAEKTKEELAELRKQMMKSKVKKKENNFVKEAGDDNSGGLDIDKGKAKKDPKQELMIRLAMGQKVQVDVKEMKKLTNKNYSNLPEIKKKKEEEKKKQETAARKAAANEYMKQLNEKRRQLLKKKKSLVEDE